MGLWRGAKRVKAWTLIKESVKFVPEPFSFSCTWHKNSTS